jgi:hypothetical protein
VAEQGEKEAALPVPLAPSSLVTPWATGKGAEREAPPPHLVLGHDRLPLLHLARKTRRCSAGLTLAQHGDSLFSLLKAVASRPQHQALSSKRRLSTSVLTAVAQRDNYKKMFVFKCLCVRACL